MRAARTHIVATGLWALILVLSASFAPPANTSPQTNLETRPQTNFETDASYVADDPASYRFEQAARLYDQGSYDSAAALYEGLLAEGYRGFAVEYNLGNAYYKAGSLGPAILHFERAARLEPGNDDVAHNLELAYLRQPDKESDALPLHGLQRFWQGFLHLLSVNAWSGLALLAAWLALLGLVLAWFLSGPGLRRAGAVLFAAGTLVCISTLALGLFRHRLDTAQRFAIVMEPSVVIKSAPTESATSLYILREGFKLQLTDATGEWVEVTLADGNVGWAPRAALEEV